MKAFVIRTQGLGILHEKIYLGEPPSAEDLEAALALELSRHGLDPKAATPTARKRWAVVVELEAITGTGGATPGEQVFAELTPEQVEELVDAPAPVAGGKADADLLQMSGTGTVTNPE